jgi:hypothetical protein
VDVAVLVAAGGARDPHEIDPEPVEPGMHLGADPAVAEEQDPRAEQAGVPRPHPATVGHGPRELVEAALGRDQQPHGDLGGRPFVNSHRLAPGDAGGHVPDRVVIAERLRLHRADALRVEQAEVAL